MLKLYSCDRATLQIILIGSAADISLAKDTVNLAIVCYERFHIEAGLNWSLLTAILTPFKI